MESGFGLLGEMRKMFLEFTMRYTTDNMLHCVNLSLDR